MRERYGSVQQQDDCGKAWDDYADCGGYGIQRLVSRCVASRTCGGMLGFQRCIYAMHVRYSFCDSDYQAIMVFTRGQDIML